MAVSAVAYFFVFLAGIVWGTTTPLIKRGSESIKRREAAESLASSDKFGSPSKRKKQTFWRSLLRDWQYYLPVVLNQSGSLFFFLSLQSLDVSAAVPLANGTTFVITAATAYALKEHIEPVLTSIGVLTTIFGICLCV